MPVADTRLFDGYFTHGTVEVGSCAVYSTYMPGHVVGSGDGRGVPYQRHTHVATASYIELLQ